MRRVRTAVLRVAIAAAATIALTGCNKKEASQNSADLAPIPAGAQRAMPPAAASPADDGNWTTPGKDNAQTRFSALNQITPANVSKLGLSFTFSTGTTKGFEAPPLVVNGTMYIITPFPNYLYALDLT